MIDSLMAGLRMRAGAKVLVGLLGCASTVAAAATNNLSRAPDPLFHGGFEKLTDGPFNDSDAARFLAQATFGPTDSDIAHLRSIGYQAWLNEQFAAAPTYEMTYLNWVKNTLHESIGQNHRQEAWLLGALGGPDPQTNTLIHSDQLRQRVAFALSEIFVISDQNPTLDGFSLGMAYYYDVLIKDAFANYRTVLQDATLNPAMGVYLNMMGNRRADLSQNLHPDENYGREVNQLFSIGLVMLNQDGTVQNPSNPIPTYTQQTVTNFAHVFTGWNWIDCDANGYDNFTGCGPNYQTSANFLTQMIAFDQKDHPNPGDPSYHDNGTDPDNDIHNKQLLSYPGAGNGGVLADGGTASSDLSFAISNIFHHPNVGPFISKQLIQRLVTSNPTTQYVGRVAAIFNNDGTGLRGNLQAVVQAILIDVEARTGQWTNPDQFGKLREPAIALTHLWRAMGAIHKCGLNVDQTNSDQSVTHYRYANQPYRYGGNATGWNLGGTGYMGVAQEPLGAFTVFNFFKPSYVPPGEMTTKNLLGPEFQMQTDTIVAHNNNTFAQFSIWNNYDASQTCADDDTFGDVKVNQEKDLALAASGTGGPSDPSDRLVDEYNKRFMAGQMSPYLRQSLVSYLNTIDSTWKNDNDSDWRLERIRRALFLVVSSPEYMIQK
jgi:uncharacterized protein (DUF1800 family)